MQTLLTLLILSLPFERVLTKDIASFNVKPPYLFGIALFLAYFWMRIRERRPLRLDANDMLLGLFIGWSFLTVAWSLEPMFTILISGMYLLMGLIWFSVRRIVKPENQERYLRLFIYVGLGTAVFGFWQFVGDSVGLGQKYTLLADIYVKRIFGFPRIQSTFFEPGFFANFLLIPLYASVYFILQKQPRWAAALYVIGCAFFLTLSRGGIYALLLTFVPFAIFVGMKNQRKLPYMALCIATLAASYLTSLGAIYLAAKDKGVQNYIQQATRANDVVQNTTYNKQQVNRAYTVRVALDTWREHPFGGVGAGAFGAIPEFSDIRKEGNERQTANSLYPEVAAETGAVGLGLLVAFLASIAIRLTRMYRTDRSLLPITLLAIQFAMFIQYGSFSTLYLVYVWAFLAIMDPLRNFTEKLTAHSHRNK